MRKKERKERKIIYTEKVGMHAAAVCYKGLRLMIFGLLAGSTTINTYLKCVEQICRVQNRQRL